jgi:hypothetical protein
MLSTASSPSYARLNEIEEVTFENCRISEGISQARAQHRKSREHLFPVEERTSRVRALEG